MMNNSMIRVLTPLLDKRNTTFHQLIKSWTYFQFSFDLLLQLLHHHSHFISASWWAAISSFLFFLLQDFPSSLILPLGTKRFPAQSHLFLYSNCAGVAWLGSTQPCWAALRRRNNKNVPKAVAAKTVPLAKRLPQKTVSSSPGYKNRLENVSSSIHDSAEQLKLW